jgi:hypothetical protein
MRSASSPTTTRVVNASYFTSLAVCTLPLVEFPQAIQVSLPACKSQVF